MRTRSFLAAMMALFTSATCGYAAEGLSFEKDVRPLLKGSQATRATRFDCRPLGRLPVIQNEANICRDHNTYGFTMWVAGGGFRSGMHGATDEFGHHAIEGIVNHFDYHATLLHLFGLSATELSFEQNSREQSLVDGQSAKVIEEILS